MSVYRLGSFGEAVGEIQGALGIAKTGDFDQKTHDAVERFQAKHKLWVDGVVGPVTLTRLRLKYSRSRRVTDISIHCSATKEGQDFRVSDIRKWHLRRGWSDVGYHYVIRLDGTLERGRPLYKIPAAVRNRNAEMIAVCYVGGLDSNDLRPKDTRTQAQKRTMLKLVTSLKQKNPLASVKGHRDYPKVRKMCPCFNATKEYQNV